MLMKAVILYVPRLRSPNVDLKKCGFFTEEMSGQIHLKGSHPAGLLAEHNPEGIEEN